MNIWFLKSIQNTNKLMILFIFFFNLTILLLIVYYRNDSIIFLNILLYILLNILFIINYFRNNNKFAQDYNNIIDFFRNYLEEKKILEIPLKWKYSENKLIEWLIKKAYIKLNIQKKDLVDMKSVFDKFVPKDLYEKIWDKWLEKIWLWHWINKEMTIMFLDIIWFTKISESMSADRALFLLNIYFDWIWEIIHRRSWFVDKYLWDWIMIIFEQETTDESIKCAIEIQQFMKKFQISTLWKQINIWIWINSWMVIMWTIWNKERMDVTVIWDNVNIASRLETLTRELGEDIIISQNTLDKIENRDDFIIEWIWKQEIKWKDNEIEIYSVESSFKKSIFKI